VRATPEKSCSERLADWIVGARFEDIPADVVAATRYRVLDVIGLALTGTDTAFGKSVRASTVELHAGGPSRLMASGERVALTAAAFANGAFSQALEFDDTHNESIVHMSSPSVSAALAIAECRPMTGRDFIAAVALGNEVSCRIGSVTPGQIHRRGFHPTGLFAPVGVTYLAGKLFGLDAAQLANAAGIVGSFAAGILECWVDGTQSKFLHPGWAAQAGITAASLGRSGTTGPKTVFEGRFGLIASHVQDAAVRRDYHRITDGLGEFWESRHASLKPFPAAHVIHPYIDAILALRAAHRIDPRQVERITCPVAPYIVGIVCEPVAEKTRPQSDSHGRVSFQYTLAEALFAGALGRTAYQPASLGNPDILALADRVVYQVDASFPGPERFKGVVRITMKDGRQFEHVEEHNRGCAENPMSRDEVLGKFRDNAGVALPDAQISRLIEMVDGLERLPSARSLMDAAVHA